MQKLEFLRMNIVSEGVKKGGIQHSEKPKLLELSKSLYYESKIFFVYNRALKNIVLYSDKKCQTKKLWYASKYLLSSKPYFKFATTKD